MQFLSELLRDVYRIDPDDTASEPDAANLDGETTSATSEFDLDADPEDGDQQDDAFDLDGDAVDSQPTDPDRAGMVRTVPGAHLVYKRESPEGGFEELWAYNITNLRQNQETKHQILSGTDIPRNKSRSEDGSQSYEVWAVGNVEMLLITGLPN